jgi:hypothetical protein
VASDLMEIILTPLYAGRSRPRPSGCQQWALTHRTALACHVLIDPFSRPAIVLVPQPQQKV